MSTRTLQLHTAASMVFAVFVGLVLAGCDSGGSNSTASPFQNEFSFDIAAVSTTNALATDPGAKVGATLDGFSFFFEGTDPETGEDIFVLYFTQENELSTESSSQELFGFAIREGPRPGAGVYDFVPIDADLSPENDFGMMLIESTGDVGTGGGSLSWYLAETGTIQLSTSADDQVGGTVSAEALKVTFEGTATDTTQVRIDGTFAAKNAESFVGVSPFTP
jgi:hypothetical protein